MKDKCIILLHGPMGSGKTTVSKKLHESIVPSARVALPDVRRIVSGNHRETGDLARAVMLQMTETYLQNDIPVVVEVVCSAEYIKKYSVLAEKYSHVFFPYYITADADARWNRVCHRTAEMMGLKELPVYKKEELEPIFAHNKDFYDTLKGELGERLDTTDTSADGVVANILNA